MENVVVLVVEDQALVRRIAAESLEDAGYSVLEAGNAEEAINILESRRDIGALFTDIDMPGSLNGIELAYIVHARWPRIHLIATSGPNVPEAGQLPARARFIRKPYAMDQVMAVLRELIDRKPIFARAIAVSTQRIRPPTGMGRFRS